MGFNTKIFRKSCPYCFPKISFTNAYEERDHMRGHGMHPGWLNQGYSTRVGTVRSGAGTVPVKRRAR